MQLRISEFKEVYWLMKQGFHPVEFVRGEDRLSIHACGWRANGSGRMKTAHDALAYLEGTAPEQWRQIYCGLTPFLVSDRGNVRLIDGSEPKMFITKGRYQVAYKPEEESPARRGKRGDMAHKKRVYRSVLVAMAFLDFKRGDTTHEVHHVNGYRTDDRLVNLMVLTHEEHARIHALGPCALSGVKDEAVQAAGLMEEVSPVGKLKLRRTKRKALTQALKDETAHPYPFNPTPVLGEDGTYQAVEAPELAAAKAQADAEKQAQAEREAERLAAEEAQLNALVAHASHKSESKSTLEDAAEKGTAAVADALGEGASVKSGEVAQAALNGEGPSKSAKRRAKKRAAALRAQEKAALQQNVAAVEAEQPETQIAAQAAEQRAEPANAPGQNALPNGVAKQEDSAVGEVGVEYETPAAGDGLQPKSAAEQATQAEAPKTNDVQAQKTSVKTSVNAQKPKVVQADDWGVLRCNLHDSLNTYFEGLRELAQRKNTGSKQYTKLGKPVYKALMPYRSCNDEIELFDALLGALRIMAREAQRAKCDDIEFPQTLSTLLGQVSKLFTSAVRRLAHADATTAQCTIELLSDEAAKEMYGALPQNPIAKAAEMAAGIAAKRNDDGQAPTES